ncbi:MAG: histidine phosphatase family protein [Candidatus Methylacidiphilales bacterium]|nr:histidine phosphatase family protein [Candidatus Methylacidiphilales bacterium]
MRLYIIRHADPDYPNKTITPAGHLEAQALSRRMKKQGLDRIYCSPLGRALHTMQYTADALGLQPTILDWTAELSLRHIHQTLLGSSAVWDAHGHTVHTLGEISSGNWHTFQPFQEPEYRDRYTQLQADSDALMATLGYPREGNVYRIERSNRDKVAVFCHGGLGLTWLAHLLNIPLPLFWAGFFLPPSSVTTVLFDERGTEFATPRCIGMGDISHLYAEDLPMQPSGIKTNID